MCKILNDFFQVYTYEENGSPENTYRFCYPNVNTPIIRSRNKMELHFFSFESGQPLTGLGFIVVYEVIDSGMYLYPCFFGTPTTPKRKSVMFSRGLFLHYYSKIFAGFYFRKTSRMRSFTEIKPSQNGKILFSLLM